MSPEEFELPVVNRSVMIVRAKKPFLDWARSLPERHPLEIKNPFTLEDINRDSAAYLIPEIYGDEELDAYLDRIWILLFEDQLNGWYTDRDTWPKKPSRKMFNDWFEIKIHSLVQDLWSKEPLDYEN